MRKKRKKSVSLGVITIIESDKLGYQVGPDLANLLSLRFVGDPVAEMKESFIRRVLALWNPKVVSRPPGYLPEKSDGRVIRVETLIGRLQQPDKAEILRRVLITIREGTLIPR